MARFRAVVAVLAASAAWSASVPHGEALRAAMVGTWCNSDDGGASCWAYDFIDPDGRVTACEVEVNGQLTYVATAQHTVSAARSCFVVLGSGVPEFRPGDGFCIQTVQIDGELHRYHYDPNDGETITLYRRSASLPRCAPPPT